MMFDQDCEAIRFASKHPAFAKVQAAAKVLFEAALAVGFSEPGAEKMQAANFAITAIINASRMDEEQTVLALASVIGTASAEYNDPPAALAYIHEASVDFLEEAVSRPDPQEFSS